MHEFRVPQQPSPLTIIKAPTRSLSNIEPKWEGSAPSHRPLPGATPWPRRRHPARASRTRLQPEEGSVRRRLTPADLRPPPQLKKGRKQKPSEVSLPPILIQDASPPVWKRQRQLLLLQNRTCGKTRLSTTGEVEMPKSMLRTPPKFGRYYVLFTSASGKFFLQAHATHSPQPHPCLLLAPCASKQNVFVFSIDAYGEH